MARWVVGDVLCWTEPDWFQKGKRKKEFFKKGERVVSGQIRAADKTWLKLEVLRCDIASDRSAKGVHVLKIGEMITRKLSTLKKREAKRVPWGGQEGESARSHVTSKFLNRAADEEQ